MKTWSHVAIAQMHQYRLVQIFNVLEFRDGLGLPASCAMTFLP